MNDAANTRLALYVTTDGTAAQAGIVLTTHRTYAGAFRRALRDGSQAVPAEYMALIQSGLSATEATQALAAADRPYAAVRVVVGATMIPPAPSAPPPALVIPPSRPMTSTWNAIEQTAVDTVRPPARCAGA